MPKQPDKDLAVALAAKLGLTMNTDVRWGTVLSPTEPAAAGVQLWVYTTGGPKPSFYMQRDTGDGHIVAGYDATVVVRVRAVDAGVFEAPQLFARRVLEAAAAIVLTISGYDDLEADESEPFHLGPNLGLEEWDVSFSMKWTA